MPYITYAEYETYWGVDLGAAEETYLTDVLIPEAEAFIDNVLGYAAKSTAGTKKLNPYKHAWGYTLLFSTWAASVTSLTINGSVIPATDYILKGDGPYWGIELLPSKGHSFFEYDDDPHQTVQVAAEWGYATTTPTLIKIAMYMYIQNRLENRDGSQKSWLRKDFYSLLEQYPPYAVVSA
jgi:hypothetical protein